MIRQRNEWRDKIKEEGAEEEELQKYQEYRETVKNEERREIRQKKQILENKKLEKGHDRKNVLEDGKEEIWRKNQTYSHEKF